MQSTEVLASSNLESVLLGVIGNILTLALLFAGGALVYLVGRRRRLIRFFNLGKARAITLYTSSVDVVRGGSRGVDGLARSFFGAAIPALEAGVIADFQRAFAAVAPGPPNETGYLRHFRFADINCSSLSSPDTAARVIRDQTIVTIGSPAYNAASQFVESEFSPAGRFVSDFGQIELPGGYPEPTGLCGFVTRAQHPETKQIAFYAAGPSAPGTVAAARYLLDNWKALHRKHDRNTPFCVLVVATDLDGRTYKVLR